MLVRIVYLDETGLSKKEEEPDVYVAGVIVHGDHQLNNLRRELARIVETHIPEADRARPVLHASDIYGGTKYFDKGRKPEWTYERRMAILSDLAALPVALGLRIVYGKVTKDGFPFGDIKDPSQREGQIASPKQIIVGAAYMLCLIETDQWFRRNAEGENCFIVVEDNLETRQFIKQLQTTYQDPAIAKMHSAAVRDLVPLRHVQEDPNFQEKRATHPLMLADFIAFFLKRRDMGDARSMQFSDPWQAAIGTRWVERLVR